MRAHAMFRPNPQGGLPRVEESAFIDPTAVVIGKVFIGKDVFVGPGAVIRADESGSAIRIDDNCNIQDRVVIHALKNSEVVIGRGASLAHGCIVHGPCRIGAGCFIGFNSVVFNAHLGDGAVVRHLAVVEGVEVGPGRMVESAACVDNREKAEKLRQAGEDALEFARKVVEANLLLLEGYRCMSGKRVSLEGGGENTPPL